MSGTTDRGGPGLPARYPAVPVPAELPEPPARRWRPGPGLVGTGAGMVAAELIVWPYLATQAGLVVLWAAAAGIAAQCLLNLEAERYTLATGATALSGVARLGRGWGALLAGCAYAGNLWPGWAASTASVLTYLFGGGDRRWLAAGVLVTAGVVLTFAPVVYVLVERLVLAKLAAAGFLAVVVAVLAVRGHSWPGVHETPPGQVGWTVLLGAIAYAGTGAGQNLVQSDWIRDKGFGMGLRMPRLVSPITGARPPAGDGSVPAVDVMPADDEANLARWRLWWRSATTEQVLGFGGIALVSVVLTTVLARVTLTGNPAVENAAGFLKIEGLTLQTVAGGWLGYLFWAVVALALFVAATGIVDYTSRLGAGLLTSRRGRGTAGEPVAYVGSIWALVAAGLVIIALGLDQPRVLLSISAGIAAATRCVTALLLWRLNSGSLPKAIRPGRIRGAALIATGLAYGAIAMLVVHRQFGSGF